MTTPSEAKKFYYPRRMHYADTLLLLNQDPCAQVLLDQASAHYYCESQEDIGSLDFSALMDRLSILNTSLYSESSFKLFQSRWPMRRAELDSSLEAISAKSAVYSANGAKGGRPKKVNEPEPAAEIKPESVAPAAKPQVKISDEIVELFEDIQKNWPSNRIDDLDIKLLPDLLQWYPMEKFRLNCAYYLSWRSKKVAELGAWDGFSFEKFITDEHFSKYGKEYKKAKKDKKVVNEPEPEQTFTIIPKRINQVMKTDTWKQRATEESIQTVLSYINIYGADAVYSAFHSVAYEVIKQDINSYIHDELGEMASAHHNKQSKTTKFQDEEDDDCFN